MERKRIILIATLLFSAFAMSFVDGFIAPPYFYKSLIKVFFFLLIPMLYFFIYKEESVVMKKLFIPKKKDLLLSLFLGIFVFSVVMIAYFIFRNFIDFSGIADSLTSGIGVGPDNFIFVAIYISFVNSLMEEFFFRGYGFIVLKQYSGKKFAYIFSAALFALYHVGMTSGWFNPIIYLLAMLGLFIGGCIFAYLNDKCENIYPSWLVHMCANFAINTIGCIIFGII